MEELQFRIQDVQGEIDALRASLKGGRAVAQAGGKGDGQDQQQAGQDQQQPAQDQQRGADPQKRAQAQEDGGATLPPELSERIGRIEERLEYLTQKWLAMDEELFKLKRHH